MKVVKILLFRISAGVLTILGSVVGRVPYIILT